MGGHYFVLANIDPHYYCNVKFLSTEIMKHMIQEQTKSGDKLNHGNHEIDLLCLSVSNYIAFGVSASKLQHTKFWIFAHKISDFDYDNCQQYPPLSTAQPCELVRLSHVKIFQDLNSLSSCAIRGLV
jgi:hypothetical protein